MSSPVNIKRLAAELNLSISTVSKGFDFCIMGKQRK